jgi:membrane protein DedA with SNARE-associated domain
MTDVKRPRRMRAYEWLLVHWPTSWRRRVAIVVALVVFVLAALPLLGRVAGVAIDLGFVPYIALVILCWVGEGGLLVPIPGVRLLSWLTIIQQGANLNPVVVALLAAVAMALGQTSYFLVVRSGSRYVVEHLNVGPLKGHLPIPMAPVETAVADVDIGISVPSPDEPTDTASGEAIVVAPTTVAGTASASGSGRSERLARAAASIGERMRSHPRRTMFLVSVIPSPLTTLATVTAAASGVPFRIFFAASFAGFLVMSSVLAFAGQAILAVLHL